MQYIPKKLLRPYISKVEHDLPVRGASHQVSLSLWTDSSGDEGTASHLLACCQHTNRLLVPPPQPQRMPLWHS